MRKIFLILSISIILFSCKKEKETISENHQNDSATFHQDISSGVNPDYIIINKKHLDKFGFPPEVEGCSCYFSENKIDFENQKFVYVDDYGNNAYLKIDGKMIKIQMEEGDFDPSNFNKTIENDNYKVKMFGKKIKEIDETMMFEGTMTIENKKTNEKTTTPIYGECGC